MELFCTIYLDGHRFSTILSDYLLQFCRFILDFKNMTKIPLHSLFLSSSSLIFFFRDTVIVDVIIITSLLHSLPSFAFSSPTSSSFTIIIADPECRCGGDDLGGIPLDNYRAKVEVAEARLHVKQRQRLPQGRKPSSAQPRWQQHREGANGGEGGKERKGTSMCSTSFFSYIFFIFYSIKRIKILHYLNM